MVVLAALVGALAEVAVGQALVELLLLFVLVADAAQHGAGHVAGLEHAHDLVGGLFLCFLDAARHDDGTVAVDVQRRARVHTLVVEHVLDVEGFAEDGEVALVLIDEDLHELAVLRLERLAHGALREAGARPGGEVLRAGVDRGCDPVAGAVERGGHIIALAGTLAGKQRRHDRAEQRHAGRQVAHAGRRADRGVVRIQAQVGDQAVHGEECHGVQAGGSGQRAVLAAVAGGVRHDQARVFLFQGVIVQVVLFQTAETHARQEHVRLGEHVVQHALVLGIVEIHVHEFLAAVEEVERGVLVRFDRHAAGAAPVANRVARFAGLDLDDSGAEAAQKLTCGGGGPIGRQLHDEKTFEWFIHIVSTSCIFQSILIARTKDNKNARK